MGHQGINTGKVTPIMRVLCNSTKLPVLYRCDKMAWYERAGLPQTDWCRTLWRDVTGFPNAVFREIIDLQFESAAPGLGQEQLKGFKRFLDNDKPVFLNPDIIDGKYIVAIKVRATLQPIGERRATIKGDLIQIERPFSS